MPPVAQTPFYKTVIKWGDTYIPFLPGARFTCPRNIVMPPIVGNYWQVQWAEGLRQPYVDVQLVVRDKAAEALSSTFLNNWFTRAGDASHDTSALTGGIIFWDGRYGVTLNNAKADSFTIGTSKGDDIRFSARFVGSSLSTGTALPLDYAPWSTDNILRFQAVNMAGALASKVLAFNLSFSNNHNPDNTLDGTPYPVNQNAGMMTAAFSMTMQLASYGDIPADGTSISFDITGSGAPAKVRRFTVVSPKCNNPVDRANNPPKLLLDLSFSCGSSDGTVTEPVTISTPGGSGSFD